MQSSRLCGSCTLCCKLPHIEELKKPTAQYCDYCEVGIRCTIYEKRPKECSDFRCMWLNGELPELMRPDKVHCYAERMPSGYVRINVDPAYVDSSKEVVECVVKQGLHTLVTHGHTLRFVTGEGKQCPQKIVLDWVL